MKKILQLSAFTLIILIFGSCLTFAAELELNSASACLMEPETGTVLYEKNADERHEPASVTKIMSLILVFEAMDEGKFDLNTPVTAGEHAASMGGSQIWLEVGETMTVHEMLKAVAVASANDCTVALAEFVSGSEEGFVEKMNEKAKALGMENTHFVNCTGLPAEDHYTTARDIAIMTRELYKHKTVFEYTTIWIDTLRNGKFGINNTNKLIRFYSGATGMKTGYTSSALYCMSATAERNGLKLIAAVMKSESSDKRFADAKKLLDYGFANYSLYTPDLPKIKKTAVLGGKEEYVDCDVNVTGILIEKGRESKVTVKIDLPEKLIAPIKKGDAIGTISFNLDNNNIAVFDISAANDVEKLGFLDLFEKFLKKCLALN